MQICNKTARRRARRILALSMGSALVPLALAGMPAQAQEARTSFDIAPQPLARALVQFSAATGTQLFFDPATVRGKSSPGVRGALTRGQALSALLAGSGLSYQLSGNTVTIAAPARAAAPAAGATGEVVLDTVTLATGAAGATEGSGSYAAPEAATATGLPLTVRETPQSVSVISDQRIKDQGFASTREALNYTTGVSSVSYETDRDSTYARGYWIGNYMIDGVALPTYQGWYSGIGVNSSAATYDRVEVLRGATGLMTGSGEPGAAVSITRKRANARTQEGSMELRFGSWDKIGGTLDLGTPLNADASVRARFIMDADSHDSFIDRYHLNRQTYYAAIDADLTEKTRLRFSLEHQNYDPTGTTWGQLPAIFSNGEKIELGRSFSHAPDWAYWSSKQTSAVAKLEHDFDNGWQAEATLGATWRQYNAELLYLYGDIDQATGEGLDVSAWGGEERTRLLSFDAKATGPVELFGRSHVVNVGVRADQDWIDRSWPGVSGDLAPVGSIFDFDGSYPRPDFNPVDMPGYERNVTKYSAYASGRFSVTDPLTLIVGGRYTDWRSEFQGDDRKFGEFVPFAGLVYDLNDQWSVYGSYTEVFDPQSYRDREGKYLDPVMGESYEIGAKAELFGGGMNATVALFDTKQDNVAVQDGDILVPGTSEFAYRGADGIRSRGIEVELAGEIREGWNLFLGATALRMKAADGSDHAPEQPRRSVKLFTSYDLPGRWEQWTVGGGLRWQSGTWATVSTGGTDYRVEQGSYAVFDAMARYDISDKWSAQLNVNNLFDRRYYNNPGDISWGEPRNATLTLVSRF
ncbi:TonB-dependent siderophore receptor [Paracoccus aminovorans]|uniref:TonB-dependent siderophore receptor n=1 Tax=Paracoccus aminovorans TaxID=34004 RepID=UPI002B2627FF|nr:TonB-dependent siderophore receptor [Paracoccus aminovorans]